MVNFEMKINGLKNIVINKIQEMLDDDFYSAIDIEILKNIIGIIYKADIIKEIIDIDDNKEIVNGEELCDYEKMLKRLVTEKNETKREIIAYQLNKEIEFFLED